MCCHNRRPKRRSSVCSPPKRGATPSGPTEPTTEPKATLSGRPTLARWLYLWPKPDADKPLGFVASVSSGERGAEASLTPVQPCRASDCQGADQTVACAIASVSEPSSSGRYSTDESVVPIPVARYRHPILSWALYPSEVRCRRRRSNPHIFRGMGRFGHRQVRCGSRPLTPVGYVRQRSLSTKLPKKRRSAFSVVHRLPGCRQGPMHEPCQHRLHEQTCLLAGWGWI